MLRKNQATTPGTFDQEMDLTKILQRSIIYIMKRTQIQVPDLLYQQALAVAEHREISMAELVRRGLEYMISVTPDPQHTIKPWTLPTPQPLGAADPFQQEQWRVDLHLSR